MFLYNFIVSGAPDDFRRIILMAAISGCANAYLVALINNAAGQTSAGKHVSFQALALYIISFAIYYLTNRIALTTANVAIERMLRDLRLRLIERIRWAELLTVDKMGKGDLFTKLIQETNHLSQSFPVFVSTFGQLVLLFFCLIYIGYLSLAALGIVVLLCACAIVSFVYVRKALDRELREVTLREGQLVDTLEHMVEGFKEIKVNQRKGDALYEAFRELTFRVETVVVGIGGTWIFMMQLANVYLYLLLGIISFLLPQYVHGYSDIIFKLSAATLFCIGPLVQGVAVAPMFMKANLGLEQIFTLEQKLAGLDQRVKPGEEAHCLGFAGFRRIHYQNITFSYRDDTERPTFTSGPWSLEIRQNEVLFLVGGNGSGKSTVLKLLTGLYPADSGTIQVDGLSVDGPALLEMRELFSVIFSDFHLFDRLYGLEDVEPERVQALIDRMELTEKVKFEDGRFSNLNLSTGQRKRLALIVSLLEDRPIYIFDEWAADQDGHFRHIFYTDILQDLKARGKTVIAVTHDDRFWDLADRVVKMDLGQIAEERIPQKSEGQG